MRRCTRTNGHRRGRDPRRSGKDSQQQRRSRRRLRLRLTTNVRNTEDALRYFPSLFVRKRHIGDTQAPLPPGPRESAQRAQPRSIADGVLLSALIGNNNSFASPRWGMVSPEEIERVDVLYGPFRAISGQFDRRGREHHDAHARKARGVGDRGGRISNLRPICDPRRLSGLPARRYDRRPNGAARLVPLRQP